MSNKLIDLTGGKTDYEQLVSGYGFYYAVGASNIQVKYDSNTEQAELVKPKSKVARQFSKLYITGNANETIQLYIFKNPDDALNYPTELSSIQSSTLEYGQYDMEDTAHICWGSGDSLKEGTLRNVGLNDVYIGGSSVTVADGYLLKPGESLAMNYYTGALYGICETGKTSDIRMMRIV